jgi:hypothetical protein
MANWILPLLLVVFVLAKRARTRSPAVDITWCKEEHPAGRTYPKSSRVAYQREGHLPSRVVPVGSHLFSLAHR